MLVIYNVTSDVTAVPFTLDKHRLYGFADEKWDHFASYEGYNRCAVAAQIV